jgi:hypothetical protein
MYARTRHLLHCSSRLLRRRNTFRARKFNEFNAL